MSRRAGRSRTTLRDGTRVLLRPIGSGDRDRLREGLRRLSPRSRYFRFHTAVDELSEDQLTYLTEVDGRDHVAWIALDEAHPEVPGVGVARYIRLVDEPEIAEAAITVADEYQGRGAGTLLLGLLAGSARSNGIEVFRNYVLAENTPMLEVFDRLGADRELEAPGLYRVDLRLPTGDETVPESPAGRAFLAAARGDLVMGRWLPPIWFPRRHAVATEEDGDGDGEDAEATRAELDSWLRDRDQRDVRPPGD